MSKHIRQLKRLCCPAFAGRMTAISDLHSYEQVAVPICDQMQLLTITESYLSDGLAISC